MFQFNASFLDENGNEISIDPLNDSYLLIEEIGKNVGFNISYNELHTFKLSRSDIILISEVTNRAYKNRVNPLESFVSSSSVTDSNFYVFLTLYISMTICAGPSSLPPHLIRIVIFQCFSIFQRLPGVSDNKQD